MLIVVVGLTGGAAADVLMALHSGDLIKNTYKKLWVVSSV